MELNKIVGEIKDMLQDSLSKSIDPKPEYELEPEDYIQRKYENCGCATCKAEGVACKDCSKCSEEEMSKSYESDNEEEDNWDNIQKACWSGYKQVGMKDKGGRKVPNCVPIKKSIFGSEGPQDLIPKNK